jgi:hypothetical protein
MDMRNGGVWIAQFMRERFSLESSHRLNFPAVISVKQEPWYNRRTPLASSAEKTCAGNHEHHVILNSSTIVQGMLREEIHWIAPCYSVSECSSARRDNLG